VLVVGRERRERSESDSLNREGRGKGGEGQTNPLPFFRLFLACMHAKTQISESKVLLIFYNFKGGNKY
jgi:hypothetical protein